jgi:hypothetical protein
MSTHTDHEAIQVGSRRDPILVPLHGVWMIGFVDRDFGGDYQVFWARPLKTPEPQETSIFRADKGDFGKLGKDRLSSLKTGPRAHVRLCEHEAGGAGGGLTVQYDKNQNIAYVGDAFNDKCSFVELKKVPR